MKTFLMIFITSIVLSANGESLYKKCVSCHGANGEKVALGKSKLINKMNKDELTAAMIGYKDGSYGGPMKAMMKAQLAPFNQEQIQVLADYISKLK